MEVVLQWTAYGGGFWLELVDDSANKNLNEV